MTPPAEVTPLALLALFPFPEVVVTPSGKRPGPTVTGFTVCVAD